MEIQLQTSAINASLILTGLSAGLFFAWSVSVIPGTQKVDAPTYLSTMQHINRAILNPAFLLVFFGSLLAIVAATVLSWDFSDKVFWFLMVALLCYGLGTIGITGLGNVPLNNELDALQLERLSDEKLNAFRRYYESRWNRFHALRMGFAAFSFLMLLLALNIHKGIA